MFDVNENRLILLSILICCVLPASFPRIKADAWIGAVHIKADGTVDPLAAPIQRNGDIYTLTGNITSDTDGVWIQRSNMTLDGAGYTIQGSAAQNTAGIWMPMVSNVTIKNVKISAFSKCISLEFSSNNSVRANEIRAAEWEGIWVYESSNNSITGNNITENTAHTSGVWLTNFSEDNEVTGNTVADCGDGILVSVSNNRIIRNNVTSNKNGIWLQDTSNVTITENTLAGNEYGIWVEDSSNNTICHNSFVDNQHQVQTYGNVNVWDNGYPSGGNSWSDYSGVDAKSGLYQNETGSDGIGDTIYLIDGTNKDHYPLMGTVQGYDAPYFTLPLVPHSYNVTVISNSTISDFATPIWIEHPEIISWIEFNVTGEQGTTGFCRISFPTALMNGTYQVFVNGTQVAYTLLPCSNSTHSYLYFTYQHSTQKVVITPEFPSFLIIPLFMTATLLAVLFCKRKHIV